MSFAPPQKISTRPNSTFSTGKKNSTDATHPLINLRQNVGNQAMRQLLKSGMLQAKLKISQPNDPYEREADSVAGKVMSAPPDTASRKCSSCEMKDDEKIHRKTDSAGTLEASDGITNDIDSIRGTGSPLDSSTRRFMESRFGFDFSKVTIHTDERAAKSARTINALAYTVGNDIMFGTGEYAPQSVEGRRLLAHELTHVVQQKTSHSSLATSIQRRPGGKTKTAPRKFYQQVIDNLSHIKPNDYWANRNRKLLEPLLALCESVEQKDVVNIPNLLDAFIKHWKEFTSETFDIDRSLFGELSARLLELGLSQESAKLNQQYINRNDIFQKPYYEGGDNIDFEEAMVNRVIGTASVKTPEQMRASLIIMIQTFIPLSERLEAWNPRSKRKQDLENLMNNLIVAFETVFQSLMDYAADQFALKGGKGPKALDIATEILDQHLRPALYSADKNKRIGAMKFRITRTKIFNETRGSGILYDMFAKGKESQERQLDVYLDDPRKEVEELETTLDTMYEVRKDQVKTMARIYGAHEFQPFSDDRNAEVIENMAGGRMRLHNDDDWRKFVLEKYKFMTSSGRRLHGSKVEAIDAIMDLLLAYMHAFTQHATNVNVYDIGRTNYLNREFPRDLAGRLLHDCGVYAVRVAYILSLVRQELALRFRFVIVPGHIALVIDGENIPMYIVNNNKITRHTSAELEEIKTLEKHDGVDSLAPKDDTQLLGELVALDFRPGVKMPFVIKDTVPPTGNAPKDQARLWAQYQKISPTELFGEAEKNPKNEESYLFSLNYLDIGKKYKNIYNDKIIPYWNNVAPDYWESFDKELESAGKDPDKMRKALDDFKQKHDKIIEPINNSIVELDEFKEKVSEQLQNSPELHLKGVRILSGILVNPTSPEEQIKSFTINILRTLDTLKQHGNDLDAKKIKALLKPPFLDKGWNPLKLLPM